MPYEAHPNFQIPQNPEAYIWRYMDFTKFISMLSSRSLFFASVASLAKYDNFEGQFTWPASTSPATPPGFKTAEELASIGLYGNKLLRMINDEIAKGHVSTNSFFEIFFINCWHMNNDESDAMWKIYAHDVNGIAIRSSLNRLKDCFKGTPHKIFIGKVGYRDYSNSMINPSNVFYRYLSKRIAFAHEQELRAIWWSVNPDEQSLVSKDPKLIDEGGGIAIPVDLNVLIDSVIVKPQSPQWLVELVKTVSTKFQLEAPILASDMSQEPPVPIP
jgi:hypothetical protein